MRPLIAKIIFRPTSTTKAITEHRRSSHIAAAALIATMTACGGGSNGSRVSDAVFALPCLSEFVNVFGGIPEISAATLDNLSAEQLTQLSNSLSAATGNAVGSLGELVSLIQSGAITDEVAACALEQGLNEQGVTTPGQLPLGPLGELFANLPLGSELDAAIATLTSNLPLPLDNVADLLAAVQTGQLSPDVTRELALQALGLVNDASPLLAAPDAFSPGLSDVLDQLDATLPGGVEGLTDSDLFALAESLTTAVDLDDTAPVTAIIAGLTDGLPVDAATAVADAVMSALQLNNIGQLLP